MRLPNLELIKERFINYQKENGASVRNIEIKTFLQMWPNASCGYDEEYTTVVTASMFSGEKIYGIFFGEERAYTIYNPTPEFFKDLKNCCMACQRIAKEIY